MHLLPAHAGVNGLRGRGLRRVEARLLCPGPPLRADPPAAASRPTRRRAHVRRRSRPRDAVPIGDRPLAGFVAGLYQEHARSQHVAPVITVYV